jgi:hypothetical protein
MVHLVCKGTCYPSVHKAGALMTFDAIFDAGRYLGYPIVILITIVGVRMVLYYHGFFFHWRRYRQLRQVSDEDIRALPDIPYIKIQVTTRGSPGSTEVIRRGIRNVAQLVGEAPDLYRNKVSVEVVTESPDQKAVLEAEFSRSPMPLQALVLPMPSEYQTPNGTQLKARGLHFMVEQRRQGFNRKPGRTFIVHYDEESVLEPNELRKLVHYLATTDKKLTEGPILYPLEYSDAHMLCRAMESNRPLGCYECRHVMETGTPLHLHGSNLVVDEELENELGWDIGNLDGQPFISEDYVFGVQAYLKYGPSIFGWHGAVMLEQPPFSLTSAFKQRFRWIFGVLQGIAMLLRMPEFHRLPRKMRWHLVWGTRYRIATFALGLPTGVLSLLYSVHQGYLILTGQEFLPLPLPVMAWFFVVGFLWLNSMVIGAWYNLSAKPEMNWHGRWTEGALVLAAAPLAGLIESAAGLWAVVKWLTGERKVAWTPTPKTKLADQTTDWRAAACAPA